MNDVFLLVKAIILGIFTGFVVSIPLGPSGLESIKRTVSKGFKEGFKVSLGAVSADVSYILLINLGLSRILSQNKITESLFYTISGFILILIGLSSLKKFHIFLHKRFSLPKFNLSTSAPPPFLSGYLITFTNPMTPSLWLLVSGTIVRKWYYLGGVFYYSYILAMICGMVLWFTLLNYLALKGFNFLPHSASAKTEVILKYSIVFIGLGFFLFGLIRMTFFMITT